MQDGLLGPAGKGLPVWSCKHLLGLSSQVRRHCPREGQISWEEITFYFWHSTSLYTKWNTVLISAPRAVAQLSFLHFCLRLAPSVPLLALVIFPSKDEILAHFHDDASGTWFHNLLILLYKHYFANEFQIYTNWTVVLEGGKKNKSHACTCDSALNLSRLPELVWCSKCLQNTEISPNWLKRMFHPLYLTLKSQCFCTLQRV